MPDRPFIIYLGLGIPLGFAPGICVCYRPSRTLTFVRLILAVNRINPEVTVHCDIQVVFLPRQTFWILRLDLLDYDHRTLLLHQDYSYIDADLHFSWFLSHYFLIDHLHEATPFILSEALPQLEEYAETVNTLREEFD